jgi:hypothetical protein
MAKSITTTDREEIKNWALTHNGEPEIIDDPDAGSDVMGLRLDFPGTRDDRFISKTKYRVASWDEFFEVFESERLGFVYESLELDTDPSMNYRFIRLDNINKEEDYDEVL